MRRYIAAVGLRFAFSVAAAFLSFSFLLLNVIEVAPIIGGSILLLQVSMVAVEFWRLRNNCFWLFEKEVRRFRTASNGRIVLHYAPSLSSTLDVAMLFQRCDDAIKDLDDRFGSALRGRLVVYVFPTYKDVERIFGPGCVSFAFAFAKAIIIGDDFNNQEMLRHEVAHLFSFQWSLTAPPLFSEGLPVWLQETAGGYPIDTVARPFLCDQSLQLPQLLDPKFFFAEPQREACYLLAGSFTGFLIRRYGWEKYRKLFRQCDGKRFQAKFKKCFGVPLEQAELEWRIEIIVEN
jgi:hypothetical protein